MLTTDLDNPGFNGQTGAVRSTGVELEGKASLNKSLDIIASVSRNDIEYTKDNDGRQGNHLAGSSPLTASAWVNYTFLGDTPLAGFGAGLGVRYVRSSPGTEYPGTATAPSFDVPSFTVYDARLSYDLGQSPLGLKGVKVDMNVENLDDKKYVANCTSNWDCYYGDGRTMTTSLTYNW
jgi:iron complex outermembrane receptor protein